MHPNDVEKFRQHPVGKHALEFLGLYGYVSTLEAWPRVTEQALVKAAGDIMSCRAGLPRAWREHVQVGQLLLTRAPHGVKGPP
eukprot:1549031-Alexandrium_andersonii.AAC.1